VPSKENKADAWFLDGFSPKENAAMWTPLVMKNIARLSHEGTSLATFTSAGFVRRLLSEEGFFMKKIKGFGKKREMLTGIFHEKHE
jgi:tRNA 5-methylaminomethyl-2-thiouridine biosynthesis bifunctional protein